MRSPFGPRKATIHPAASRQASLHGRLNSHPPDTSRAATPARKLRRNAEPFGHLAGEPPSRLIPPTIAREGSPPLLQKEASPTPSPFDDHAARCRRHESSTPMPLRSSGGPAKALLAKKAIINRSLTFRPVNGHVRASKTSIPGAGSEGSHLESRALPSAVWHFTFATPDAHARVAGK